MNAKKFIALLVAVLMVVGLMPVSVLADEATVATTVTIATVDDLKNLVSDVAAGNTYAGKKVVLAANLDLVGSDWYCGIYGKPFSGEFDGAGYTISNLTDSSTADHKGLFAHINGAYIHDIVFKNVSFSGTCEGSLYAGAVAAELESNNIIKNITVDGMSYNVTSIDGSIGGIGGYSYDTHYDNCSVTDIVFNVTSNYSVNMGGLVGQGRGVGTVAKDNASYSVIEASAKFDKEGALVPYTYYNCSVDGATFNVSGKTRIGGFIGVDGYSHWANYGKNCEVTDLSVTCAAGDAEYVVGGFMGYNYGANYGCSDAFYDCSVTGTINSNGTNTASVFGGFLGWVGGRPSSFSNCTANVTIDVVAGDVGGFVGETQQYFAHEYKFDNCNATGDVTTEEGTAGGFIANIQHGGDGSALNVIITNSDVTGTATGTASGAFVANIDDTKGGVHTGGNIEITDCSADDADAELFPEIPGLTVPIAGTITKGYISNSGARITGELTANTTGSELEIKLFSGNSHIATSTLTNEECKDIEANEAPPLTWNFVISGDASSSWNTTWVDGQPNSSFVPDRVELWINGEKIAENEVVMYAIDNYSNIYDWAALTGVTDTAGTAYFTVTADKTEVVAGETVEVQVWLNGTGVSGAAWEFTYDKTMFTLQNGDDTGVITGEMAEAAFNGAKLLGTYTFEAIPQDNEVVTATFTVKDTADSWDYAGAMDGSSLEAAIAPAEVTINLMTLDVSVSDNGNGDYTYRADGYTVTVTENSNVGAKIEMNGQTTNELTFTEVGEHTVTYTVSKLGYKTVTGTHSITVTAPAAGVDYVVEVNLSGEDLSDYVAGKKLVLVYTNNKDINFTYDGADMYDVTAAGYEYVGDEEFVKNENTKVYALVVDAIADGELANYEVNVAPVYETGATVVTYSCDLNGDENITLRDVSVAYGVLNQYAEYFTNNMDSVLMADVNGDKIVTIADADAVMEEYNS